MTRSFVALPALAMLALAATQGAPLCQAQTLHRSGTFTPGSLAPAQLAPPGATAPQAAPERAGPQIATSKLALSDLALLQGKVEELSRQLEATRRELQAFKVLYSAHTHLYRAPGDYEGLQFKLVAPDSVFARGENWVLLGGKGVSGNVGPLYPHQAQTAPPGR